MAPSWVPLFPRGWHCRPSQALGLFSVLPAWHLELPLIMQACGAMPPAPRPFCPGMGSASGGGVPWSSSNSADCQTLWTLGEKQPRLLLPRLCPAAWRRAHLLRGEWPVYKACTVLPSPSYTPAFPSPSPQDAKMQPGSLTHLVLALHLIHKDIEAQRG